MPHANIMLGYPTHCEGGLVLIRGPKKIKIAVNLRASICQLWGGARSHIRDMRRCDGIIHEAGQVTNFAIECSASVMRWTCPTFPKMSRARRRQMSSWLLLLTAI